MESHVIMEADPKSGFERENAFRSGWHGLTLQIVG